MSVVASASHFPKNGKHFDGAWPLGPKVNIAMIRRGANITRASLPGTAPLVGLRPTTSGLSLFFAKTEHTEAKHADREAAYLSHWSRASYVEVYVIFDLSPLVCASGGDQSVDIL
jgi:hypothetical protein